jgi:hypothetical protein
MFEESHTWYLINKKGEILEENLSEYAALVLVADYQQQFPDEKWRAKDSAVEA